MTDGEKTVEQYQKEIADLKQQLKEAKNDTTFDELKTKYEKVIEDKDKEIQELKANLDKTNKKVDETVDTLNDEIQQRLDANEEYQKALATIKELETAKAETTVDTFIQQGKILPAQRETALKLCLNDNDTFMELYRDAKPIIDLSDKPKSNKVKNGERLAAYFKN
jgi:predicted RNase H-like nuclease (RuvC/YqgF family)